MPNRTPGSTVAATLAATCAAAILAGCGGDRPAPERWRLVTRLTSPADAELFSAADLRRETVVAAWRFAERGQAPAWRVEPAAARKLTDRRGVWLRGSDPTGEPARLTAEVDLAAESVSVFELRLRSPGRTASELAWAGPGQPFTDARRLAVERSERTRDLGPIRVVRFRVGEHPAWRGPIRRLELRPAIGSKRDFAVVALRAIRSEPTADLARTAAARAWKVDLDATVRQARPALTGHPWTAEITLPEGGAELRLVPGLSQRPPAPVELRVDGALSGGPRRRLFSASYPRAGGDGSGWQRPVRVPLEGRAGDRLTLSFEVAGAEPLERAGGFAVWGNVRLVARERRDPPPSLVLVSIDTLRADHLSIYGYPRSTSPAIDRWAHERAVLFETAVAPTPWTLPSFVSIFTGLDPIRHGSNYHLPAPARLEMLAETLAANGYETAAWTGGGYLGPGYGLHQGFERLSYHLGDPEGELVANVERALAWLGEDRRRPFFLFFHTYEVHEPYLERQPYHRQLAADSGRPLIPAAWVGTRRRPQRIETGFAVTRRLVTSDDRGDSWRELPADLTASVVDRYDSGIRHADEQIGRLLAAVDAGTAAGETIVVLTSDHGEALGEHGLAGHAYLHDFNLLVPLIIAAPAAGWPAGGRVAPQVRSVDLVPTLHELLGLAAPTDTDGASLTPLALGQAGSASRPAWSYAANSNHGLSLRLPPAKYILNNTALQPLFGSEQLFDLARDPAEVAALGADHDGERQRLRRQVEERLARQAAGVWFHLRSGPRGSLSVELAGNEVAAPTRLKALRLPGGGVSYPAWPARLARIELPADAEALLYAEATAGARMALRVAASTAGPPAARWSLTAREVVAEPWSVQGRAAGWSRRRRPSAEADGPWITVFATTPLESRGAPGTDEAAVERLRALGYLR